MTHSTTNLSNSTYLLEEEMILNDKWEILSFIAKGGKGEVYLARQLNLDRQVALKIMSNEFIESLEGDEEELLSETKRFHREVQIMARMQHPNILQVFDFDQLEINGIKMDYIAMEYIPGLTLRQKMPKNGFGHDEIKIKIWLKKYFFPILDGMKAVHDRGVVHRDMKPENVLVDDELPKIMDFGVAGGHHLENVTQAHHMLGTITYMPEEQFMDLALTDPRVDVYALGKILYEVVEGTMKKDRDKPFNPAVLNDPQTLFFKKLDQILQQATARNRNQRTPSVKTLQASLEELFTNSEEKKDPPAKTDLYYKYLFGINVAVLIIFVGAVIMHYAPEKIKMISGGNHIPDQLEVTNATTDYLSFPEFNFKNPRLTSFPSIDKMKKLPAEFLASDNTVMILLTGAKISMPIDSPTVSETKKNKKTVPVKTLYMSETKTTNHLYVQFLNEVDRIKVKGKSVLRNGQLLLLLGEVKEGYEPITFKEGVFRVKPDAVAKPVVRVTPVGALAYAHFYGKALPLMKQWWLAVQPLRKDFSSSLAQISMDGDWELDTGWGSKPSPLSNLQKFVIRPVALTTATQSGIFGLEQNVNEWTMGFSSDDIPQFHIHGGVGELNYTGSYLERQPWEAFSTVGFRTVLNLEGRK